MKKLPPPGTTFVLKKQSILAQLAVPDEAYTDASPKGSVDAGIRDLIGRLNAHAGLVTTSSCAGRVSVYLEGEKKGGKRTDAAGVAETARGGGSVAASSAGGKGGGEWLFVSHDPVVVGEAKVSTAAGEDDYEGLLGLRQATALENSEGEAQCEVDGTSRLIHFKFEPMVGFGPYDG